MTNVIYSAKVEGVDKLAKTLMDTGDKRARRFMLKALVGGAKPLRASIRSEATFPTKGKHPGALRQGVRYKASRKSTGQIAYMVGPYGKGTAQRHLVIYGHDITGHKPNKTKTGQRTKPNNFVQRGEEKARSQAYEGVATAAKAALAELTHD